jgi:hypothetical protein
MLSWTTTGAVEKPTSLQIRVQRSYPGRIRAGAPEPTRSMSAEEVVANIRHFTAEQQGPRGVPCTALVLSGVGVTAREDAPAALALARELGIRRVILHAGGEDLDHLDVAAWAGRLDVLVLPLQPDAVGGGLVAGTRAVRAAREAGVRVSVNTVLDPRAVDRLDAVARSISRVRPDEVTFSYPFPINGGEGADPSPIPRTVAALQGAVDVLAALGITPRIKGLPACYLGRVRPFLGRSANRWYVDADHQRDRALLFFPEVVSFTKEELCRFCACDDRCDGFFATYLRRPGFPPLDPIEEA